MDRWYREKRSITGYKRQSLRDSYVDAQIPTGVLRRKFRMLIRRLYSRLGFHWKFGSVDQENALADQEPLVEASEELHPQ
jgi:hypothetical protein